MSEEGKVEIIEKRIQPTVIRRRRRVIEPPKPPEEKAEAVPKEEPKPAPPKVPEKPKEAPPKAAPPKEERVVKIPKERMKPARVVGRVELKELAPTKEVTPPPQREEVPLKLEIIPEVPKEKKPTKKEREREELPKPKRKRRKREVITFEEEDYEEILRARHPAREVFPGKPQKKPLSRPPLKPQITTPKPIKKVIRVDEEILVADLAQRMGVKLEEMIKKLMDLGVMATANQTIDVETATLIATEYGYEVTSGVEELEKAIAPQEDPPEKLRPRPPVVTVMGHVDHGKTLLLDAIRKTNVVDEEAGGITQHIGAYRVEIDGNAITFIDTPGHEAFTAMRARGAQVTDIVVLVVAADDGVMPQTIEAINHARAAGVPIVVAINKIDKPEANPERVRQQLAEQGLIPEQWGGDTLFVEVSAKKKTGIEDLLEAILLQAELLDLKANPDKPARGTVIEAKLDRGRGPVATVLVKEGTLRRGASFVAGPTYGRVRGMINEWGDNLKEATPSTPVEVVGFAELPQAGDDFIVVQNEKIAKEVAAFRQKRRKEKGEVPERISLEEIFQRIQEGEAKELRLILKGDTHGSVQAVREALEKLSTDEVKVNVIHQAVGAISSNDVNLAAASGAVVIGFNVQPDGKARALAEQEKVQVRTYQIIYELIEDVQKALRGMLAPEIEEVLLGRAEVRQLFNIPRVGVVAGCYVQEGKLLRGANVRLYRGDEVVHEGKITSLKRFKEDVREVASGYECGVGIEGYSEWQVGDIIEAYVMEEKREG